MSVAKLRVLVGLCLLGGVGLVAYPVAAWLFSELIAWQNTPATAARLGGFMPLSGAVAPAVGKLALHLPFLVAFFVAGTALLRHLRNLFTGSIGVAVRSAALMALATCALWIGLLFTFSLLASLDRLFIIMLFIVTLGLLLCVRPALELGFTRASSWIAIGAVLIINYGVPTEQAALRPAVTGLMALAMLASFLVLGGALARRGTTAIIELVISTVGGLVLFVAAAFFLDLLAAVPRGLLLVSFAVTIALGLIRILLETLLSRREGNPAIYHAVESLQPSAWAELLRPPVASVAGNAVWILQRGEGSLARLHFLASALADAGRAVIVCVPAALASQVKPEDPWAVVSLPRVVPLRLRMVALLAVMRWAARFLPFAGEGKAHRFAYERRPQIFHDKVSLRRFAAEHPELHPAVVICVDWEGGPVAEMLARSVDAKLVYDISEYETDQFFNDARWVAHEAPVAAAVATATQQTAALTIVAAEALRTRIRDRNPHGVEALLVRTAPTMAKTPDFKPIDGRIHLLYCGDIIGNLGIEALIDAMASVQTRYRLTLSGQADHGFLGDLKRRIARLGLDGDVAIDLLDTPGHKRTDVTADAGIVLWSLDTPKVAYCVPEQLFEHVQTGRAVFLIGVGEAADLVRDTRIGSVIAGGTAAEIGAALNSISADEIEACKRAAVGVAAKMNRSYFGRKLAVAI